MKATQHTTGAVALAVWSALAIQPMTAANTIPQTILNFRAVGTTSIQSAPLGSGAVSQPEIDSSGPDGMAPVGGLPRRANLPIPSKQAGRASQGKPGTLPLPEPTTGNNPVVPFQSPGFSGFNGLSHVDSRLAGNGNQFSLEPPDQGLCAANGYVVETVNAAIAVYNGAGVRLAGVDTLNHFFQLAPAIDRATGIRGPFLADPRCLFDRLTQRWFVSETMMNNGTDPSADGRNYLVLAVSQTSSPTGQWTVFFLDVTDDGPNGHPGCPCFADQPLIGADDYGFYVSTNEYAAGPPFFNGAQIYAASKTALAAAAVSPTPVPVVAFNAGPALLPYGGITYSVHPAITPPNGGSGPAGIEYFLSALQFGNPGYEVYDNRIAAWALTNTSSLNSSTPNLTLQFVVISSETYGQPDPAAQRPGVTPLGTALGEPLEYVATNDDRMNQVVFAGGLLYGAVNSKLKVAATDQTGIAWFAVKPAWNGPQFSARVVNQDYVAVRGNNAIFPSIAMTDSGDGVMVFSIVGPDYYPSVAYVTAGANGFSPTVHIGGAGQAPDDGFTGYPEYTGGHVARWGDYSAATSDGQKLWFAGEYIPNACTTLALPCRTALANWGTFIGSLP